MEDNKKVYDGTCIFCDMPVSLDSGYYTDGMIIVCPVCASRKTLVDVCRAIDYSKLESNLMHRFIPDYWKNSVRIEHDDSPEPYDPATPIEVKAYVIHGPNPSPYGTMCDTAETAMAPTSTNANSCH